MYCNCAIFDSIALALVLLRKSLYRQGLLTSWFLALLSHFGSGRKKGLIGKGGASDRERGGGVLQVSSSALFPFLAYSLIPNVWILLLVVFIFLFLSMKKHQIFCTINLTLMSKPARPHIRATALWTPCRSEPLYWLEAQNLGMDETWDLISGWYLTSNFPLVSKYHFGSKVYSTERQRAKSIFENNKAELKVGKNPCSTNCSIPQIGRWRSPLSMPPFPSCGTSYKENE